MASSGEESFELDTEGWVDDGGYEENWSSVDKGMFGAAWVASMKVLEAMPLEHLSDDGFIPDQWNLNQKLIQSTILSLGFTDAKLLVQKGDELSMTAQLVAHLGLEVVQDSIQAALRFSSEAPAVTGISDAGEGWMIPGPGRRSRRSRLSESTDVITRASQERELQAYLSGKVMVILTEASAPVIILASEAADPQGIWVGAVGAARGSTMESYTKTIWIFLQWLRAAFAVAWPEGVVKVVEFLHTAGSKPCSPSFPGKFLAALAWYEKVGGWARADRFSGQELVKRTEPGNN